MVAVGGAVCHGYCGRRDTRRPSGGPNSSQVAISRAFSWPEEDLARVVDELRTVAAGPIQEEVR